MAYKVDILRDLMRPAEVRYFAINASTKRCFYINYLDGVILQLDYLGNARLSNDKEYLSESISPQPDIKADVFGDARYVLAGSRSKSSFLDSDFSVAPIYTVAFPKKFGFLIFPKDASKEHKMVFREGAALTTAGISKSEADSIYESQAPDWALVPYTARYF